MKKERKKIPWKGIFTSMPYFSLLLACMVYDFIFLCVQNELPKYMRNMLGFNAEELAVFTSMPYIFSMIFGLCSGVLSDYIVKHQLLNITTTRKLFISYGIICPALFGLAAVMCTCNHVAVICMFILAVGSQGVFSAGWVNFCDISPAFSALLTNVANTITSAQGFVASLVVGAMIGKDPSFERWQTFFAMVLAIAVIVAIFYLVFGSAVRQKWDIEASAEAIVEPAEKT